MLHTKKHLLFLLLAGISASSIPQNARAVTASEAIGYSCLVGSGAFATYLGYKHQEKIKEKAKAFYEDLKENDSTKVKLGAGLLCVGGLSLLIPNKQALLEDMTRGALKTFSSTAIKEFVKRLFKSKG